MPEAIEETSGRPVRLTSAKYDPMQVLESTRHLTPADFRPVGRALQDLGQVKVQLVVLVLLSGLFIAERSCAGEESGAAERTMGVIRGDCKKCHPSEVSAWMKSTHFFSADLRLASFSGNTQKYAQAMNIDRKNLMTNSVCADCHGTRAWNDSELAVVSGVSCEKCHGAAGGDDGWLNRHQSYHASRVIPRQQETTEHRQQRIDFCTKAGMVRSEDIAGLARACYRCHLISNETLVSAGHKLASTFEFVGWSEGEIRHNFLTNRNVNAAAPSLWLESTGGSVEQRRRLKFVIGTLVQLEMTLRARAEATSPVLIPQLGGQVAAANGRLMQINGMAPTEEVAAVSGLVTPMLGLLFAAQPGDEKTYSEAADTVAKLTEAFQQEHDGSQLTALDALIAASPPHYSQQFRERYMPQPFAP